VSDLRAALREDLATAHRELRALLDTVRGDEWDLPTPNEGWTVKDTLAHLCTGESGNLLIARRVLNGEATPVEGFDLNRWNQRQVEKRRAKTPEELWQELDAARAETLAFLETLTEEHLQLQGYRPTGDATTLEGVIRQIARHERMHTADIRAALGRA
jgi:uncharacterized protein (TIGR03083 family)